MASQWGATHRKPCRACGETYDKMTTGLTWTEVRNLIIALQTDRKTGKTKYGRRRGVLGYWHELKMQMWDQHIGLCEGAMEDALEKKAG